MNYYNYFTEIEDAFVSRRGSHIHISPLDWSLIESWRERGVPLDVVLRGIHTAFDGYDRLPRRSRSTRRRNSRSAPIRGLRLAARSTGRAMAS